MPISYSKLIKLFEDKGITSYTVRKENIIGQASWKKIYEDGNIDMRTVERLCKYFHCQPGDLLEYVED
ncbi:helix-turn-helix domain-containing protein [Hominenteromicrobium sp.]|uniref:helix-turn-helix domain-containing protein n=1 Tax=Hominenteromicrobium sp. TaxID=3073581 RepID=UPI003A95903E